MYSLIFPILLFFAEGLFGFETDGVKSLSVIEGDSVTLPTCIQRQNYKKLLWMFEKSLIAKIKEQELSTEDGPDGIFRDRLKLDFESGSLTIKNIRSNHSGLYQVDLISTTKTTKIFNVTVIGVFDPDAYKIKSVSVMEGESVTLNTDVELQKDDLMLWKFAKVTKDYVYDPVHHNPCQSDATIVKIYGENRKISLDDGEIQIFNNVLKVDKLSGSLTITSVTPAHSGFYILQRTNNTGTKCRRFRVTVSDATKSHSYVVWMSVALVFIVLFMVTFVCLAVGTKNRNALLWSVRSSKSSQETESKSMMEGQSLILDTKHTELTTDDVIEWRYKGSVIARIGKTSKKMYNGADGQFRDRLELDTTTGSLTITNTTNKDAGDYQLLIVKNEKVQSNRKFNVCLVRSSQNRQSESDVLLREM